MKTKEISSVIDRYFAGVQHSCTVRSSKDAYNIELTYTDFKPEVDVVMELTQLLPMCVFEVERLYSKDTVLSALWELYQTHEDIIRQVDSVLWSRHIK